MKCESFPDQSQPETSAAEMRVLLNDPSVKAKLEVHFKELAFAGILRLYNLAVRDAFIDPEPHARLIKIIQSVRPSQTPERMRAVNVAYNQTLSESWGAESSYMLVGATAHESQGRKTLEETGIPSSYYFLDKVGLDGLSLPGALVTVGEQTGVAFINCNDEQIAVLQRHYQDQVDIGIIYRGQIPPKAQQQL